MHIAASSPISIDKSDLKKELIEKELEIIKGRTFKFWKANRNDRKNFTRKN